MVKAVQAATSRCHIVYPLLFLSIHTLLESGILNLFWLCYHHMTVHKDSWDTLVNT